MPENASSSPETLPPGYVLGERYRIRELIGSGGMAKVYSALDLTLRRETALKILSSKHYSDEEFVKRFYREAQSAARLSHKSIASIFDVGELEGRHYIAMELVKGKTLEEKIRECSEELKFFPIDEACSITTNVLDALSYAHSQGIVHRDIKPGNIMLPGQGGVKITDFGIAKAIGSEGKPGNTLLTQEFSLLGTPQYMSPEQIQQKEVSGKSDAFSTGIMLYELLASRLPFGNIHEMDNTTKLSNIITRQLQGPRSINRKIPKKLEDILLKALEKEPGNRYDAQGFCEALDSYIKGETVQVSGSWKRRLSINRRQFIIKGAAAIIGASAAIGTPAIIISKKHAYNESIYSTLDRIQRVGVDTLEKAIPLLKELYPKLCERLEWIYDVELSRHIEAEKGNEKPMIYPLGSTTAKGREGEFVYLNGESSLSGFISPMMSYLFEHKENKSRYEKEFNKKSLYKSKKIIDDFFFYATKLYFVEGLGKNDDETRTDEETRVINRFYYPAHEVLVSLKNDFPEILEQRKEESSLIVSNYARAVKIAIEKIIPRALGNPDEFSISRDYDIALPVCESFYLLDIEKQVLPLFGEHNKRISSAWDALDLIIREADMKMGLLKGLMAQGSPIVSKDYAGLMCGLVARRNLLEDLASESLASGQKADNNGVLPMNALRIKALMGSTRDYEDYLHEKREMYDESIRQMTDYFISKNPLMTPKYYLQGPQELLEKDNPIDMIALLRFWEALRIYPSPMIGNNSKDEVELRIIKSLLTKEFMSGKNKLPPTLEHPFGFVKGTIMHIQYRPGSGSTNMESDYLLFKNIISKIRYHK